MSKKARRQPYGRRRLGLGISLVLIVVGLVLPGGAAAWTPTHYNVVSFGGDSARNYSLGAQQDLYTNAERPVDLIFWNNARINPIKAVLGSGGYPSNITFTGGGSTEYAFLRDNLPGVVGAPWGWAFDGDGGKKTRPPKQHAKTRHTQGLHPVP